LSKNLRPRQLQILQTLWRQSTPSSVSRRDLHRTLHAHPNLVGKDVKSLIRQRIVREGDADPIGRGRPSIPLEIDPDSRHVIGLSLAPGAVEVAQVSLTGARLGSIGRVEVADSHDLISRARAMLMERLSRNTLAIGVSTTGLYDEAEASLLISSAFPGQAHVSLAPILKAAGTRRVLIRNDMYALAARWLLSPDGATDEDILLASMEDGRIGAAMLLDGRPNRGCLVGGNELGHTRFTVPTPLCFCGHRGCLERIFSSEYLRGAGAYRNRSLADVLLTETSPSARAGEIVSYLAQALANTVNFVRPHRVIFAGTFAADARFATDLAKHVHAQLLAGLSDRVRISAWNPQSAGSGETAAWLALTEFFIPPSKILDRSGRTARPTTARVAATNGAK
jgi:predicted NBD/HSP70 family sugar kinase